MPTKTYRVRALTQGEERIEGSGVLRVTTTDSGRRSWEATLNLPRIVAGKPNDGPESVVVETAEGVTLRGSAFVDASAFGISRGAGGTSVSIRGTDDFELA